MFALDGHLLKWFTPVGKEKDKCVHFVYFLADDEEEKDVGVIVTRS